MQSAVLRVLAIAGDDYAPFQGQTVEQYRTALSDTGDTGSETNFTIENVQQCLTVLQQKGLVWRAARGVYALENQSLVELLA